MGILIGIILGVLLTVGIKKFIDNSQPKREYYDDDFEREI
jgi:predicted PurR-regulated permease PerM